MTERRINYNTHQLPMIPSIGDFNSIFEEFNDYFNSSKTNYPPYNILKTETNDYILEVACSGFTKEELKVELVKNVLVISGIKLKEDNRKYIHKGISSKSFLLKFALDEAIKIKKVSFKDGLLIVETDSQEINKKEIFKIH